MRKLYLLFPFLVFFTVTCEEEAVEDITPPTVTIISPQSGSTVSEVVSVNCILSDSVGVDSLELLVDGISIGITDTTEPYSLEWNIRTYENGEYTIFVRSYYTDGDTADSEPIILIVNNPVYLWGQDYLIENTEFLDLSSRGLTGTIPPEIGNLVNLKYLWLNDNQLTGTIPSEIGNLTNLLGLFLFKNQLSGLIPSEIGNLTNLKRLYLNDNQLADSIPSEIGNLINLTYLYLYDNQLTGSIPVGIENLLNLKELWLEGNQLTGSIPSGIGSLINLNYLWLNDNQLTGSIPSGIGNLNNLERLYLNFNFLTGEIPSELGNLIHLEQLWLNNNQLTREISENICDLNINWSSMIYFNIYNNQLCPPYPSCIEDYVGEQDTTNCP